MKATPVSTASGAVARPAIARHPISLKADPAISYVTGHGERD